MTVLLSIKPEFADKIFNGEKRFEFRRKVFGRLDVVKVVVYATKPVGKIIGEFEIAQIHSGKPSEIWAHTEAYAGISHEFFSAYFAGKDCAHAIEVGSCRRYDVPVDPREVFESFTAPQFFCYWRSEETVTQSSKLGPRRNKGPSLSDTRNTLCRPKEASMPRSYGANAGRSDRLLAKVA